MSFRDSQSWKNRIGFFLPPRLLVSAGGTLGLVVIRSRRCLVGMVECHLVAPRRVKVRSWHSSPLQDSIYKHICITGVHLPKSTLSRFIFSTRDLHEAFIQGQVVTDGVLPAGVSVPVVAEVLGDPVVYGRQGQFPLLACLHGHTDEASIGIWRFYMRIGSVIHVLDRIGGRRR